MVEIVETNKKEERDLIITVKTKGPGRGVRRWNAVSRRGPDARMVFLLSADRLKKRIKRKEL